jgi:hypothetical protein
MAKLSNEPFNSVPKSPSVTVTGTLPIFLRVRYTRTHGFWWRKACRGRRDRCIPVHMTTKSGDLADDERDGDGCIDRQPA